MKRALSPEGSAQTEHCHRASSSLWDLFGFFFVWASGQKQATGNCKTFNITHKDTWNKRETCLFLKLAVKQRGLRWSTHPESPPHPPPPSPPRQSPVQSISSSQSVLLVCRICFGTCRPLIDTGAEAGKTLLWRGANHSLSVTLPQMFGPRAQTAIKIWTFTLLFSFPLLPASLFFHFRFYLN